MAETATIRRLMDLLDLVDAGCEGVIYLAVGWSMHVQAMMCGFPLLYNKVPSLMLWYLVSTYECLSRAGFACFDTLYVW